MATFIEIIEGANAGSRIPVSEGKTLGRGDADININDPKISGIHAEFIVNPKGQLVLADLESSNGLYIGGRRVKKVTLLPGVTFEVGRTQFKVVLVAEEQVANFEVFVTWRGKIGAEVRQLPLQDPRPSVKPESFSPALKLQFIQGIQTDEEIILGYGPRQVGADSLDIELLDDEAPREAFTLTPGPGVAQIKIKAFGQVTLNKKAIHAETLKDGDLISVGTTLIRVSYV